MASILVTPRAQRNLAAVIETHSLPESTLGRFRKSLAQLRQFPLVGAPLPSRKPGLRFVLGPWRWMIIVYRYYEEADEVRIISVQDARSAHSPTTRR